MVLGIHRLALWCWRHHVPVAPLVLKAINRIAFGVVIPPATRIGSGVLFSYQGLGTVVHRDAVIERNAIIGTGAKVLGPVKVGAFASIGANAVTTTDVPALAVAVGVPARVVRVNRPDQMPDYHAF